MLLVKNKLYFGTLLVALACVSLAAGSNLVKRQANDQKRVVCYYANWAVYRQGLAKFSPQNINPYLCTHLIYAFGGLQKDDTLAPFDKYQDLEKSGYSRFAALKTYNKELKTMLAIGGWNEASKKFSPMVEDPQRRNKFIKSAIRFLRQYNFDGIDLDWEYPTQRKGGRPQDRENYAKLIEEMRDSFEREADQTGKDRLIISMAVPASLEITAKGFDVRSINKNLDFFNILAYDYHSSFEPAVNHHAPLFRTKEISEFDYRSDLNIESTIKYYIGHGASPDKLVLGIPTYGRSYKLLNPDAHTIGSPTDGPGTQGNGTKEDGYLAYYEICNGIKEQDWEVVNENRGSVGPYAHHDTFWVGYDDMDIVKEKAYYVAEEGLGGIMFWTIDNDDFRGTCHNEPYPLIEAAKRALYSSSAQSSDRPRSLSGKRTTTPTPPTTPSPEPSFVCTDEGFFPHSKSCKKYYWCLDAAGVGMVAHTFTCPQGLFFNSLTDGCDFKRNVDCENKSQNEEVEVQSTTTEPNQPSNPNDKSVQDILEEIKEAGGLEAFEEKLQEEEEEKKGLKQRTKVRNEGISNKTRNRFSQILERKKPKTSEPSTSSDSSSSETKQPGSLLSRLSNRRRNSLKSSDTKLEAESPSTTSLPSSTSSTTSPTRSGFIRNRNRPSFLRNKPTTSAPKPEEALEEENEVTPIERPRNSQFRNRIRNNERTPFRNRGSAPSPKPDSGLGNSDPVQISSDSFRSKTPTVRRNFGRISEEEKVQESNIDVPTQSLISTEEDSSLSERSQNDESRNLAYVTIDRSRARGKTSNDRSVSSSSSSQSSPVVRTSTSSTEEVSKDQGNRVRGLEYVTIQRGVSSRKKLLSKVEKESHLQDAEESAEDAESLEERLRQRLQQRKIKKSQNRSSLFNNPPRRPSFIRSRQPTTSTESSSVFVPTVSSTSSITITTTPTRVEEVSVQFNIQEEEDEELQNIITTNTVSPTIAITEPTQTTTQISSTARPFRRLRPISSSFSSPPTPLTTPPSFSSPSSPRRVSLRPDSPSPRPNRFRSKPFGPFPRPSSRPNRVRPIPRNPTPSSLTTPEPVVLLEFTTPIPQPTRSRLQPSPAQTFTPIPITFSPSSPQSLASSVSPSIPLFVSQSPEPSTSSPILVIEFSSTTPSQTSPSSFSSSQYPPSSSTPSPRSARPQPRRLNAFRNRFQVSPSSPSPIISKSREEELFTKVRQEQNALRLNRPSKGPISQNIPRRTTTTISTTAEISTDSTTIRSTPQPTTFKTTPAFRLSPSPLRTTPATSRPRVPSRSRSRPRPRPRPRPTTTTQAPKEYEYYYEDFPEEGNNGIGGLKSVDPFYDYELTPLSNKVSITSAGIKCHDVGVFQHPGSCKKFIRCSRRTSQGRIEGWEYECPNFLVFDPVGGRCNWAAEVDCS